MTNEITWQEYEVLAVDHLKLLPGILKEGVERTPPNTESVDAVGDYIVSQVKAESTRISTRKIRVLHSVAIEQRKIGTFYSLSGYTSRARIVAESLGIALYRFMPSGEIEPENRAARLLNNGEVELNENQGIVIKNSSNKENLHKVIRAWEVTFGMEQIPSDSSWKRTIKHWLDEGISADDLVGVIEEREHIYNPWKSFLKYGWDALLESQIIISAEPLVAESIIRDMETAQFIMQEIYRTSSNYGQIRIRPETVADVLRILAPLARPALSDPDEFVKEFREWRSIADMFYQFAGPQWADETPLSPLTMKLYKYLNSENENTISFFPGSAKELLLEWVAGLPGKHKALHESIVHASNSMGYLSQESILGLTEKSDEKISQNWLASSETQYHSENGRFSSVAFAVGNWWESLNSLELEIKEIIKFGQSPQDYVEFRALEKVSAFLPFTNPPIDSRTQREVLKKWLGLHELMMNHKGLYTNAS